MSESVHGNFERYQDHIVYAYNTREGGVSTGVYASMNLSLAMPDDPENIRRNYGIWCASLGVDPHDLVMVDQTHSNKVIRVGEENRGQGLYRERIHGVDGMVTNVKGLALVTSHADCVPIYLYDPVHEAIGMVHAGWKGTILEIARNAVLRMAEEFGSVPGEVIARIGPCISQEYFECDRDVIDAIDAMTIDGSPMYYYIEESGKYHASLAGLNRLVLMDAGVPGEQIDMRDTCTYGNPELYFSHRRQGRARGGQAALLMMRE